MPRAKGGPKSRARRKKRIKLASGQYGGKSRLFRSATESVDKGQVYAYHNVCAHRGVELDWEAGQFFDITQQFLVCATHGALYDPTTGHCVRGPCAGQSLVRVEVTETDGQVWLCADLMMS